MGLSSLPFCFSVYGVGYSLDVHSLNDLQVARNRMLGSKPAGTNPSVVIPVDTSWSSSLSSFSSVESNGCLLKSTGYLEWSKMFKLAHIFRDASSRSKILIVCRDGPIDIKCKADDQAREIARNRM
ncbi:hypothetical protein Taro_003892 [Colocasia esculenta]|uniref:Uncharacterized protein n=1 Tax=Colocasia esculenta TaxID=4460 RepID=A0A843TN00_COLES|nr:hypothetical protein [Colocasia esculenta]